MRKIPESEIIGKTFGRLTAVRQVDSRNGLRRFLFKCECGNHLETDWSSVKRGRSKSCGCSREIIRTILTRHGMSGHTVYRTWSQMRQRCTNRNREDFKRYGGRGIKVCDRWLKFENFKDDMMPTWKKDLELDRIDNNGDYSPDNCRWATRKQQMNNYSRNRVYKGKTIKQWAEELGINYPVLASRITRYGWSWDEALNTPVRTRIDTCQT